MQNSEIKNLLRGFLPYLVLKLAEAQVLHGYELISLMKKRFGVYFGPSTIYPLLRALEREGLLTSQWDTNSLRPRKNYTITEDGRDVVAALTSMVHVLSTFTGQMYQIPGKPQKLERPVITLEQ